MNEFPTGSTGPTASRTGGTSSSWRNFVKSAMRQSRWSENTQHDQHFPPASKPVPPRPPRRHNRWLIPALIALGAVIFLVVLLRIALGPTSVKRETARVVSSGGSLLGLNATPKPKPSPAKPLEREQPKTQLPPSPWISMPAAPPVQLNTPAPQVQGRAPVTSAPAPPPTPVPTPAQPSTAARAAFPSQVFRARRDKHFGGTCAGQLTLSSAGLVFDCPSDPHESFQVALNEIGAVDDNGVRLLSGKKYHFSITGMSKSAEENLFANWLHQVR